MKNLLAGLGLGIAAGLLLAPGPGSRLRRRILGQAERDDPRYQHESSTLHILNSASREDLLSVHGLGSVIADQVVQNRPFASEQQLVERNVVPESNFDHFKRQLQRKRTA
jgi:DNA uptake protein ComE-like DNA-binding protein